jgi:hypothetical protein
MLCETVVPSRTSCYKASHHINLRDAQAQIAMRHFLRKLAVLILTNSMVHFAALASDPSQSRQRIQEALTAKNWIHAEKLIREAMSATPKDGELVYDLALVQHNLRQYENAAENFEASIRVSKRSTLARYNAACARTRLGQMDSAFDHLERSLSSGFLKPEPLEADPDLVALRKDPRYPDLLHRVRTAAAPCEYDDRYHLFDFWIGNWDVYGTAGLKVGESIVARGLKGCLIAEDWKTGTIAGRSLNTFDSTSGKWRQFWVSSTGGSTLYEGGVEAGPLRLVATVPGKVSALARITWTPLAAGRVRQHGELSADNGQIWSTTFDFIYVPKTELTPNMTSHQQLDQ